MSGLFVDNDGKRDWKKIGYRGRSAFAVIVSLVVLIGGGWFVADKLHSAYVSYKTASDYPGPGGADVQVTIPSGSTIAQIGQVLVDAGVVKSVKAFRSAADNSDSNKFQAGEFKLKKEIPAATAVTMLLDPKNKVLRQVTIPEGMWVADVLKAISAKTGIPLADLKKEAASKDLGLPSWASAPNLPEGFLFPDTYQYDTTPTAAEILPQMVKEFNQVTGDLDFAAKAKALGYTPMQVLSVASIAQAEVPAKYQPMVAGIMYNRIKQNMPLGLDTSLHYALQLPMTKLLPANATTTIDSPFNTYKNKGFMPGAMNSPGKTAMQAALNPTKSDYLYFVTVNLKSGETKFGKTLQEHNQYVAEFNAWCKANAGTAGCP